MPLTSVLSTFIVKPEQITEVSPTFVKIFAVFQHSEKKKEARKKDLMETGQYI